MCLVDSWFLVPNMNISSLPLVLLSVVLIILSIFSSNFVRSMNSESAPPSTTSHPEQQPQERSGINIKIEDDPLLKLKGKHPGRFDMKPGLGTMKGPGGMNRGPLKKDPITRGAERLERLAEKEDKAEGKDNNLPEQRGARKVWTHLVGKHSDEAKNTISQDMPGVRVVVVPEGAIVTMDYREDRVRIYVNSQGMVAREPMIG